MQFRIIEKWEDDKHGLKELLHELSTSVKIIFLESNFIDVYKSYGLTKWELFKDALLESVEEFKLSVDALDFSLDKMKHAGFTGVNLELKIEFWNRLAQEANLRFPENRLKFSLYRPRIPGMGYILRRLLAFINIILESAGVLGAAHGLDEMKKLGEFILDTATDHDHRM